MTDSELEKSTLIVIANCLTNRQLSSIKYEDIYDIYAAIPNIPDDKELDVLSCIKDVVYCIIAKRIVLDAENKFKDVTLLLRVGDGPGGTSFIVNDTVMYYSTSMESRITRLEELVCNFDVFKASKYEALDICRNGGISSPVSRQVALNCMVWN